MQGGTTIYGQRRSQFDPQPNINAIGFMCDIPADQFTNDAIVDVQRSSEYGNSSYLDVRLIKGYKPGFSNTLSDDDNRRVLEEAEEKQKEEEDWISTSYLMRVKMHKAKSSDGLSTKVVNIEDEAMSIAQERLSELYPSSHLASGKRRLFSGLKESLSSLPKVVYQSESRQIFRNLNSINEVTTLAKFELQYEFGEGKSHMKLSDEGLTEWEAIYKRKYGEQALLDYRRYLLADLSGLSTPEMQPVGSRVLDIMNKASSRKLAPGNPPYNITRSDLAVAVDVRYLANLMPYEILLMISRTTNIFNMTLLPGGWTSEHKLVRDLDWYEQDKIYCMTYYNYTIEDFNQTNADCSPYIWTPNVKNCTNVTSFIPFNGTVYNNVIPFEATDAEVAMGGVIRTLLNCTNVSIAHPISKNVAFNDLFSRRRLQESQTMPNGRFYPYAHAVSPDSSRSEKRVLLKDDEEGDINIKKRRLLSSDYERGLLRLKPTDSWYMDHPSTKSNLFEHSHAACWVEDIIDRTGQPSARLRCPRTFPSHSTDLSFKDHPVAFRRILYAHDAIQSALNEIESIGGQASRLVIDARRKLQGVTETIVEPYNYPKVPPRQSFTGQVFPFSQLVPGVLPNVPRVTYQSILKFFGTNFDPVAGVQYLTSSVQEGTSKQDGPPTLQFFPSRIHVLVDPRGIPLKPLYAGYPFPQQPVISLIDRHNRLFVQGNVLKDIKVVAFIDPLIFPEVSSLVKPLKLTGQTQFFFTATGSGTISFFDLGVSLPVKNLFINFTATYVTTGTTTLVHGATRPFEVSGSVTSTSTPSAVRVPFDRNNRNIVALRVGSFMSSSTAYNGCSSSTPSITNPAPFCGDVCCGADCLGTNATECNVTPGSDSCANALLLTNCSSLGLNVSCTTLPAARNFCQQLFASPSVAVFLDEFSVDSTNGTLTLVQSIPLPTTGIGNGTNGRPNRRCTNSGQATAESQITLSEDNNYIIHTCYDAPIGLMQVPRTVAGTVPRVIARIDMNGSIDTSTTLGSFFAPVATNSTSSVARRDGFNRGSSDAACRSAASFNGQSFWATGSINGIVYASYEKNVTSGSWDLQSISDTINGQSTGTGANLRSVQIKNCNVFVVAAPAPVNQTYPKFIYSISSGLISGINKGTLRSMTTNTSLKLWPLSPGIGKYFSGSGSNIWNSRTSPYDFEFQPSLVAGQPPLLWICDDSSNVQFGVVCFQHCEN